MKIQNFWRSNAAVVLIARLTAIRVLVSIVTAHLGIFMASAYQTLTTDIARRQDVENANHRRERRGTGRAQHGGGNCDSLK